MKNVINFVIVSLFFLTLVSIFSCNKQKVVPIVENKFSLKENLLRTENTPEKYWGYLQLLSVNIAPNINAKPQYGYGGAVFSPNSMSHRLYGGNAHIGNLNLVCNPNNSNSYGTVSLSTANSQEAQPLFGQQLSYGITGDEENNIPSFSTSFYVPKELHAKMYVNDALMGCINFKQGSTVKIVWEADEQNENGVGVYLRYIGDHGVTTDDWTKYELTEDDGEFTVPSNWFTNIGVGKYFEIGIGRGNGKIVKVEGRSFAFYGLTSAMTDYKMEN
jgi:hypothetical protein